MALIYVVEDDKTVSFAQIDMTLGEELGAIIGNTVNSPMPEMMIGGEDDKTISFGFFGMTQLKPVTGWLICMNGSEKGKDFRLHADKNFVGRSTNMDVVLIDDKKIARDKHCSVVYDPRSNLFFASAEGGNLTYVNGEIISTPIDLKEGDIITIGDTDLLFVRFCKGGRSWEG